MTDMLETILDRNLLGSFADVTLLYNLVPGYDSDIEPVKDLIISLQDLKDNDLTIDGHSKSLYTYYSEFLSAILGDNYTDHSICDNLFLVRYKNEVPEFISRPKIALVDGIPQLIVGVDNPEEDLEALHIPLVETEKGITLKGSKLTRLTLSSLEIEKSDQTKVKLPILCFNFRQTVYAINLSLAGDATFYDLQTAWDDRDFPALCELIAPPYGASANISTIFNRLFDSKVFPSDGIIIPLTGFTKTQKPSKNGGKFWIVDFTVNCRDLFPIQVTAYYDGAMNDEVPINAVNRLTSFQDAREPIGSLPFTDKATTHPPTAANPWYLHVKGKNPSKKCPVHVIFTGDLAPKQKRILEDQKSPNYFTVKQ